MSSRKKLTTKLAIFCALSLSLFPLPRKGHAGEYFSLSGLGGSRTGIFAYQGLVALPFGSFDSSGPVLRAWGKTFAFNYRTDIIDPKVEAPPIKGVIIGAQVFALEAEAGYQLATSWGRLALFAGGSYRDHVLSQEDNRSPLNGNHFGAKLAVDGALGPPWGPGVSFNGSYITGVDEYWAQLRPRYRWEDGFEIGLDIAAFGGVNYDYGRVGLFASGFDLSRWGVSRTYLGAEIGGEAEFDLDRLGAYGALHVGYAF
jgi:hypothetical protein